jgi:hypothetical protein
LVDQQINQESQKKSGEAKCFSGQGQGIRHERKNFVFEWHKNWATTPGNYNVLATIVDQGSAIFNGT